MSQIDNEKNNEKNDVLISSIISYYDTNFSKIIKNQIKIIYSIINFFLNYYISLIVKRKAKKLGYNLNFKLLENEDSNFIKLSANYFLNKMFFTFTITTAISLINLLFKKEEDEICEKIQKKSGIEHRIRLEPWKDDEFIIFFKNKFIYLYSLIKTSARYVVIYSAIDYFFN